MKWPFMWGAPHSPAPFAIEREKKYWFPDHECPSVVPDNPGTLGHDYSLDPEDLGGLPVIMTGADFINELLSRDIPPEEIGEWSKS